jgi:hypothetical protein
VTTFNVKVAPNAAEMLTVKSHIKYKKVPFVRAPYLFVVYKCCKPLPVFLTKQAEHVYYVIMNMLSVPDPLQSVKQLTDLTETYHEQHATRGQQVSFTTVNFTTNTSVVGISDLQQTRGSFNAGSSKSV